MRSTSSPTFMGSQASSMFVSPASSKLAHGYRAGLEYLSGFVNQLLNIHSTMPAVSAESITDEFAGKDIIVSPSTITLVES